MNFESFEEMVNGYKKSVEAQTLVEKGLRMCKDKPELLLPIICTSVDYVAYAMNMEVEDLITIISDATTETKEQCGPYTE